MAEQDAFDDFADEAFLVVAEAGGGFELEAEVVVGAAFVFVDLSRLRHLRIDDGRISLIPLPRMMGTSVRELEDTYFRWLTRTDEPNAARRLRRGDVWALIGHRTRRVRECG